MIFMHDRHKVCVSMCLKRLKRESRIGRGQKRKAVVHQQTELAPDLKTAMWAWSFRLLV